MNLGSVYTMFSGKTQHFCRVLALRLHNGLCIFQKMEHPLFYGTEEGSISMHVHFNSYKITPTTTGLAPFLVFPADSCTETIFKTL